jgi:excisionase family DNA binding protein
MVLSRTAAPLSTMSVPDAGRVLGVCRNTAYALAARGEIPTVRIGRKLRVPTHRLLELLDGEEQRATEQA